MHKIIPQSEPERTCAQKWTRVSIDGTNGLLTEYPCGPITQVAATFTEPAQVLVWFADGSEAQWTAPWFTVYNAQLGTSVSPDGSLVLIQTWERGLIACDSRTGKPVWRTKSRRGITNLYVNQRTILCHQHDRALQLLDLHTGQVLQEKRPAASWGFRVLKEGFILCRTRASKWEILRTENLETVETIPAKALPDGCIQKLWLSEDETALHYEGFQVDWDTSVLPARRLPNLEYSGTVELPCFRENGHSV